MYIEFTELRVQNLDDADKIIQFPFISPCKFQINSFGFFELIKNHVEESFTKNKYLKTMKMKMKINVHSTMIEK